MAVRGEEGGDESVYVWPENSFMIRVIKEPALSTHRGIQVSLCPYRGKRVQVNPGALKK